MGIHLFQSHFSAFCLVTYLQQKYEFSESEILECLVEARKVSNVVVREDEFYIDLRDAVCMLMLEGTRIVFTHRSFQEYFTAYAVVRLPSSTAKLIIRRLSSRLADGSFQMLFDMNKAFVEENYFSPMLDKYAGLAKSAKNAWEFAAEISGKISVRKIHRTFKYSHKSKEKDKRVTHDHLGWVMLIDDDSGVMDFMYRLQPSYGHLIRKRSDTELADLERRWQSSPTLRFADEIIEERRRKSISRVGDFEVFDGSVVVFEKGNWLISEKEKSEFLVWYNASIDADMFEVRQQLLAKAGEDIAKRRGELGKSIDQILNSPNT